MLVTHLEAAVAAHRAGDLSAAAALYEAILRDDPCQPDALNLLGLLAQSTGDLARAGALIEASIVVRPDAARSHYNLAIVRSAQGDRAGAVGAYETAIALEPTFAEAHGNLANLYRELGRRDDALRASIGAIRARPDFAPAHGSLGTLLIELERYDEAIAVLEAALRLAPDLPELHANLGQAYRRRGRYRDAIDASRRAIALRSDYCAAHLNLSLAAADLDDLDTAQWAARRAAELRPADAEVACHRSRIFYLSGEYQRAAGAAEAAIALRPDYAEAHVNLALSLLVAGDLALGWRSYPWMWRVPSRRSHYPYLERVPLWTGEAFAGRRLVVTRDQGYGDAIHMVRYLPEVKRRGGRVVLETSPALVPLLAGLPGVDELRVPADPAPLDPRADFHIPLLGLPGALGTELDSIPANTPYLAAPPERVARWRARLERPGSLRVGVVWSGSPAHAGDHHRSASVDDFAPLGTVRGIAWFGLQKGRDEDCRGGGALSLEPLGGEVGDFGDTAAILTQLDLVIAVDTAIVHLAGALGKPVWTLLPFAPDWRWLIGRDDSPWYPSMRLFRQPRPGDWASVIARVAAELAALAARGR